MNWNSAVQLYDGISVPLANVTTSTVNVSPVVVSLWVSRVEELRRNVPAAGSQLIDAEIPAPTFTDASSFNLRYFMMHDSVTFCPGIGVPET